MNHRIEKLPVLVINAHSRCNCRCVMCDIWKTPEHTEFPLSRLQEQLPALERLGVESVVFGGGEPLMHSDLFALCRLVRSRGIQVSILSTGLLLERYATEIADSVDEVIVSLDGPPEVHDRIRRVPGAFQALERGVAAVVQLRVTARSTVQKMNHSRLRETMAAAREIGLRSISFLAADVGSSAFGREEQWSQARADEIALDAREIPSLEREIEYLVEHGGSFVADTPEHLRRIVRHFRAHLGLEDPRSPRCNAPWVSAVWEADGRVRPCFFHPVIGAADRAPLDHVLNQETGIGFRTSLDIQTNPICRRCVCSLHLG